MKKGLFISALVALCAFVAVAQSENVLEGHSFTPIEEFESFVSVDVSDLNVESGFVLSFTLNQKGIDYLNGWGNKAFYKDEDPDLTPVSTPVIVSMGPNEEEDYLYGVGWSGKPHTQLNSGPTGSEGSFAITTAWDELTFSEHLDRGGKWCRTEPSNPDDKGVVIDLEGDGGEEAQEKIKAVALTLTGDMSGLLELTASVKYKDGELRVFTAKNDDEDYYLESLEGGNLLMVNTGFVDVKDISLSYEFEEGETAESRNLKLLSSDAPSVPEPATATLSLLALAGLAARRRRK